MCMGSDMAGREVKMLSIEDYFNNYKCGYEGCSCGEIVDGCVVINIHRDFIRCCGVVACVVA